MQPQEVQDTKLTEVVVSGFTANELTELRRGLVQRMSVAQSNIRDKRNKYNMTDWRDIYETCWSAYSKITRTIGGSVGEHADEFNYLSRPVGED